LFVNAVECKECNTTVYSRTEDDVRKCSCGRVTISGGLKFFTYDILSNTQHNIKKVDIGVVTPNMLYEDWHQMYDQFGFIKLDSAPEEKKNVYVF
jgi:ribosomal protein S27E